MVFHLKWAMQKESKNFKIKLGIFLMVFSGVFFALVFIIPLLDLPTRIKVVGATASYVVMQIVFWLGGLLAGKEIFTRYKTQMNPINWFKKTN